MMIKKNGNENLNQKEKESEVFAQQTASPKKTSYCSPRLQMLIIEMENGIANSSASVRPTNSSSEVKHTWQVGQDHSYTTEW